MPDVETPDAAAGTPQRHRRLRLVLLVLLWLLWLPCALWGMGLLWFQSPGPGFLGPLLGVAFFVAFPLLWWWRPRRRRGVAVAFGVAFALLAARWATIVPQLESNWAPEYMALPTAAFDGDRVTVHDVRDCRHRPDGVDVRTYDATYDLRDLEHIEFLVIPFGPKDALAHTMLTFGFKDGRWLAVSVEVRRREGVHYHPVTGAFRRYEICYVIADERDAIHLRSNVRGDRVYLVPLDVDRSDAAALLRSMLERATDLAREPEFYNSLTDNCTTTLVKHVNALRPGYAPWDWRVMLPGSMGEYVWDLGIVDSDLPYEEGIERFRVDPLVQGLDDLEHFSEVLRSGR